MGLYEPHLNYKAEGQGRKLPGFQTPFGHLCLVRREKAKCRAIQSQGVKLWQLSHVPLQYQVWAGYHLSLSVLFCFGIYMIKIETFRYIVCIHTYKQTHTIPLSSVTHAFNHLSPLGPCPGGRLSQEILPSALITRNRKDTVSILRDLRELWFFSHNPFRLIRNNSYFTINMTI